MSDTNTETKPAGKAPSHTAYHVRDREGQRSFWTRIGSAWAHAHLRAEVPTADGTVGSAPTALSRPGWAT